MSKNKNIFNSIKVTAPPRSEFDLTHDVKLTGNMGNLIPILNMEAVPGDSFKISADTLIRFAPMLAPVMHRMDVSIHYFFVPNRILWRNWDDFISGKGTNVHPHVQCTGSDPYQAEGTLWDYLGLPYGLGSSQKVNALPFAAYQKIYNEYYRDQNLIAPVIGEDEILVDGDNQANYIELFKLRKRAWQHDYFTSALPSTQIGNQATLPLGDLPVHIRSNNNHTLSASPNDVDVPGYPNQTTVVGPERLYAEGDVANISINTLRRATRLQEWLELAMRAGRRYKETLQAFFGVDAGDARLNRPEYITGVRSPIVVSEVLNTTGATGANPQGAMAGHGVAVNVGDVNSEYFCKEHGWIMGIMSVLPLPAYQDGIHRSLHRRLDKFDYYWPQFANIGEQEVYLSELRAATGNPNTVFGYVPRYSEYKYMPNRVAGNFRSSLDFWHAGRKFSNDPALNQTFIEMDSTGIDSRIFAVKPTGSTHSVYAQVLNKIQAIRPMPKFGTPTL